MTTKFIQEGDNMTVVAPAAVNSGDVVIVSKLVGIAQYSAASAANVEVRTRGVFQLRKLSGASTSAVQGAYVYWDATNANATISATSNTLLGVLAEAVANADTTCKVRLNGSF